MKTTLLIMIMLISMPVLSKAGGPADDTKKAALTVLQQKCNVCHRTDNPGKVFTIDNMEHLAPKIYKQVFIKRRMPKGRQIQLSEGEAEVLRRWLEG